MLLVEPKRQPLIAGDCLSREDFLQRRNQLPDRKFAELIEGVVYRPSPLSVEHSENDGLVSTWWSFQDCGCRSKRCSAETYAVCCRRSIAA